MLGGIQARISTPTSMRGQILRAQNSLKRTGNRGQLNSISNSKMRIKEDKSRATSGFWFDGTINSQRELQRKFDSDVVEAILRFCPATQESVSSAQLFTYLKQWSQFQKLGAPEATNLSSTAPIFSIEKEYGGLPLQVLCASCVKLQSWGGRLRFHRIIVPKTSENAHLSREISDLRESAGRTFSETFSHYPTPEQENQASKKSEKKEWDHFRDAREAAADILDTENTSSFLNLVLPVTMEEKCNAFFTTKVVARNEHGLENSSSYVSEESTSHPSIEKVVSDGEKVQDSSAVKIVVDKHGYAVENVAIEPGLNKSYSWGTLDGLDTDTLIVNTHKEEKKEDLTSPFSVDTPFLHCKGNSGWESDGGFLSFLDVCDDNCETDNAAASCTAQTTNNVENQQQYVKNCSFGELAIPIKKGNYENQEDEDDDELIYCFDDGYYDNEFYHEEPIPEEGTYSATSPSLHWQRYAEKVDVPNDFRGSDSGAGGGESDNSNGHGEGKANQREMPEEERKRYQAQYIEDVFSDPQQALLDGKAIAVDLESFNFSSPPQFDGIRTPPRYDIYSFSPFATSKRLKSKSILR